jgi:cell division transport system permease protein
VILYYLSEGLRNIGRNKLLTLTAIFTISVSMTILGIFLILFLNLNQLHQSWSERVQITLYLKDDAEENKLVDIIREKTEVAELIYTSKEEALAEFQKEFGEEKRILESIGDNPLPSSLDITIKKKYRSSEFIEPLVEFFKRLQGVEEVHYGEEWVKDLTALLKGLRLTGLFLGSFLALGVTFIVSNTIRLTLYSRQEEIEIMKLIGATKGFIKGPFLVEGALQGTFGGALSLLFLYGLYHIVAYGADLRLLGFHPSFLTPLLLIQIPFSGLILGLLGSLSSMGRFLKI